MTRTPFDQFSKQFLEEFLTPLGEVEISREVPGESRLIDVRFVPSAQPSINPVTLGLLGQIATTPCLLEPFRHQPTATEVRHCLLKLFLVQAEVQRQTRRDEEQLLEAELPHLWLLTPSASETLLNSFAFKTSEAWLPGIYFLGEALRSAIVAINQLPSTEETLWVRLLGKGVTQRQAIAEILAFPLEDPRRSRTLKLLSSWKITIEVTTIDEEERELMMALSQAYTEWEQETERRAVEAERRATLTNLLAIRFGAVDQSLISVVPVLMQLPPEDYARLLLDLAQLSREDLLARFQSRS